MKNLTATFLLLSFLMSCSPTVTTNEKISIKNELAQLVEADQVAAFRWEPQWEKYKDSVFTANKIKVEKMFNEYGFLGFDKVGKKGSNDFWLIVQHSDKFPDFQKRVLRAMAKEVNRKNASATNYAFLFDRIQVNAGLKQKFGTQVDYEIETTGRAIPKIGLIDSANVDIVRKQYDLSPLKDYLNHMTTMHYEMNRENYQKRGIMTANLYQ